MAIIIDSRLGREGMLKAWDDFVQSQEIAEIAEKYVQRKYSDRPQEIKEALKVGFISIFQEPEAIEIMGKLIKNIKESENEKEL